MEHDEFCPHETPPAPLVRRPPPLVGVYAQNPHEARERKNRTARSVAAGAEFIGECGKHGETLYDTETGACLSCVASLLGEGLPVLVAYRAAGATQYPKGCPEHGPGAMHLVRTARCVACFAEDRGDPARVRARKAGLATFDAHCAACGPAVPHHVSSGTCAACTNTVGKPRTAPAQQIDPARVAARAAGLTTYQSTCDIHGATAFHTTRGKCLRCFNTLGQPRKRDP